MKPAEPAPIALPEGIVARARRIYELSDKADDFLWARYCTRPYAALLLSLFDRLPWNPNLLSIASLAWGLASVVAFAFWPGLPGLWAGWVLGQISYTVDCMDGMLARAKKMYSPSGIEIDFLVDAIKQTFLFTAVGYRLWVEAGTPVGLAEGWPLYLALGGTPFVASSLAMTTFLRSPAVTGDSAQRHREHYGGSAKGRVMAAISFAMNYPSWILLPVIFDRMDLFLLISIPLYVLYSGYAMLRIVATVCTNAHYRRTPRPGRSPAD